MNNYYKVSILAVIVMANIALLVFLKGRGDSPDLLETAKEARESMLNQIESGLAETAFQISDDSQGQSILLQLKLNPGDAGKTWHKKMTVIQKVPIKGNQHTLHAMVDQNLKLLKVDDTTHNATIECVEQILWSSFSGNNGQIDMSGSSIVTVDTSGYVQDFVSNADVKNVKITFKTYGTPAVVFSDRPVSPGDTWDAHFVDSPDFGERIHDKPPFASFELVNFAKFSGISCALIRSNSMYYVVSSSPSGSETVSYHTQARTYIDVSTGLEVWSERETRCDETGVSSIIRSFVDERP